METDVGSQLRVLHFDRAAPAAAPSWQGHSVAEWLGAPPAAIRSARSSLRRRKRRLRAGVPRAGRPRASRLARQRRPRAAASKWSRRICGPAICARTEFRTASAPSSPSTTIASSLFGNDYLQVVTVVTDPTYLTTPFVVSNQFKREPDDSKWNPTPCATDAPLGTFQPPAF